MEVLAEEECPEAVEHVHLGRLAKPKPLAVAQCSHMELLVLLLDKAASLEQVVAGVARGACIGVQAAWSG